MESKNKGIEPLPDTFENEEQAGAFWDAHSTSNYEGYLEPHAELVEVFDTHEMRENEETLPKGYFEVDTRKKARS